MTSYYYLFILTGSPTASQSVVGKLHQIENQTRTSKIPRLLATLTVAPRHKVKVTGEMWGAAWGET